MVSFEKLADKIVFLAKNHPKSKLKEKGEYLEIKLELEGDLTLSINQLTDFRYNISVLESNIPIYLTRIQYPRSDASKIKVENSVYVQGEWTNRIISESEKL